MKRLDKKARKTIKPAHQTIRTVKINQEEFGKDLTEQYDETKMYLSQSIDSNQKEEINWLKRKPSR